MHRLLTALARGFKEKIGWKRLGIAASLLIIGLAITHLVHTLKGVDTGVILTALTDIAPHRIALAALCVVGAFCTLTFYDFFALRTIGKNHVPYRIAAMSSFTSYTVGHNIGATVFTGGAIRFRAYSRMGLTPSDIARVIALLARERQMAVVLVEQYFEFARDLADRITVMVRGEVALDGPAEALEEDAVRRLLTV